MLPCLTITIIHFSVAITTIYQALLSSPLFYCSSLLTALPNSSLISLKSSSYCHQVLFLNHKLSCVLAFFKALLWHTIIYQWINLLAARFIYLDEILCQKPIGMLGIKAETLLLNRRGEMEVG